MVKEKKSFGGEKNGEGILGKYRFAEKEKTGKKREENNWRRKIFFRKRRRRRKIFGEGIFFPL